jgi:hypothetical protein
MTRRTVRLNVEALGTRELPGSAVTSPPVAATKSTAQTQSTTTSTSSTRSVQVPDLIVAQGGKRHYSHIRVAMLAYNNTPVGDIEKKLLKESVDLVIPHTRYLGQFDSLASGTPQMIYSNVSNIYLDLHTDWLSYADNRYFDREGAFYHVSEATPFKGDSGSSKPVDWFWAVKRGSDASGWKDFTPVTKSSDQTVAFAPPGQSVVVGYPEKFREITVTIKTAGDWRWTAQLEYATARDSAGRPTGWKALPKISDGTGGLRRTGTITFDPPTDWRTAKVDGSDQLYYVRFRTTGTGKAPVASSLAGRDYVKAGTGTTGTIPAFDAKADRNGDGYLADHEYRYRRSGFDARFEYESRLFYPGYGQMRFATNPANGGFRNWAVDYSRRFLAKYPQADGLFLDNSVGKLQTDAELLERTTNYAEDYASLVGSVESGIGQKWVLANTAGAGKAALPLARYGVSTIEEFALRPMAHNWQQFEDMARTVSDRLTAMGSNGYLVLDTYPSGGSVTDPRMQVAALAYYYLLADPDKTFVMFNGGYEPSTTWSRHWTNAVKYDVGKPKGTWSVFATGKDPQRNYLDYKVYQRQYDRALVLYKPLSYKKGATGLTADATSTVHKLNGNYRELRADGTLGPVVTYARLRAGEGAILVKA